jgi:hypothetical protein
MHPNALGRFRRKTLAGMRAMRDKMKSEAL